MKAHYACHLVGKARAPRRVADRDRVPASPHYLFRIDSQDLERRRSEPATLAETLNKEPSALGGRHRERTQAQNRQAAEVQLEQLLREVMVDEKVRKATSPTLASKKRRIDYKRRHGQLKKQRQITAEE